MLNAERIFLGVGQLISRFCIKLSIQTWCTTTTHNGQLAAQLFGSTLEPFVIFFGMHCSMAWSRNAHFFSSKPNWTFWQFSAAAVGHMTTQQCSPCNAQYSFQVQLRLFCYWNIRILHIWENVLFYFTIIFSTKDFWRAAAALIQKVKLQGHVT